MPGDPVTALLGLGNASPEYIEEMRENLGLNDPLTTQYIRYLQNILKLDFGVSMASRRAVWLEIAGALPATLELVTISMGFALVSGIYLGLIAARRKGSAIDNSITLFSLIRWCIPVFWIGLILQLLFAVLIPIFPVTGRIDPTISFTRITGSYILDSIFSANIPAFTSSIMHLVLPVLTLSTMMGAQLAIICRANLIQVADDEFVRTARLKGCSEKHIFRKHVLPNALIPILTYAGAQFAMLAGGLVLTEQVFSWPGLGRVLVDAIYTRDFQVVQGCMIFIGIFVSFINIGVDIIYSILDPRVRY
jgi:peptide/nickel transport system permease protein